MSCSLIRGPGRGINPCGKAVGIAQFQAMICKLSYDWGRPWRGTLDQIDEAIRVEFDALDKKSLDRFLFDDSFQLSRQYFTVLQLLRIMPE